jgi:polyferredoxin
MAGGLFIGLVLITSLFVYRPWCHFFCPFGLVGWLAEKISIFKVKVDYDKCIACGACSKACPSTVMGAILKQDRITPDCFSCGTCMEACPADAISFDCGKRPKPPQEKFEK